MAEAMLSGSLQLLFNMLLSSAELSDFIQAQNLSHELLINLKRKLLTVLKLLNDAEMKQFSDRLVKEWLVQVKDTVYHAEDLLDVILTGALQRRIEAADSETGEISTSTVQLSFESRLMVMISILENMGREGVELGLKVVEGEKLLPISQSSSSLADESSVYGREDIKEEMAQWLLSDKKNAADNNVDVMSIVGIGGSGKTTLAQLLYNHEKVNQHFQLKAWVCVSTQVFLVEEVMKSILKEVGCAAKSDGSLNSIQLKLKDSVGDKKMLLVLDDVWDMKILDWDSLRIPLLTSAEGSKIVVTSRSETAARIMEAVPIHHLQKLSPEDCWSLFTKLAFPNGDLSAYPQLEPIGRGILNKCQGLPLAVKAVGSLLHSKVEKGEWEDILNSSTWYSQIDHEILPSLALSYQRLSPPAKRCFAYCSVFPKNYELDKDKLILLWMAEGLLDAGEGDQRMEDVGESCFQELIAKLFFQKSSRKESCFVMHDLIHDLAQHVSGEFCARFEDSKVQSITRKTRHFLHFISNLDRLVTIKKFETVGEAQHLRTFLDVKLFGFFINYSLSQRVFQDILPRFKSLRVMSLSHYSIMEVPDSIQNLKQLRYLDLSSTRIRKLPESICCLCNLQTLILSGCCFLLELPSEMGKLINLRYLDITRVFQMKEMPHDIQELKSLQRLPYLILAKESTGFGIGGLGELSGIRGALEISKMENVLRADDAAQANLKDKRCIEKLSLNWDGRFSHDAVETGATDDILDKLQPHPDLTELTLINYPGVTFPDWLGDPSFLNLSSIKLSGCGNCSALPPLGQLPCLKLLVISKMKGMVRVGSEFYGKNSSSLHRPSFPSLQTLSFEDMSNWETWLCSGGSRAGEFPSLQKLSIKLCPKFTGGLPMHVPSLEELNVEKCPLLLVPTVNVPAMRGLQLIRQTCGDGGFLPLYTSEVEVSSISELKQVPVELVNLYLTKCDDVETVLEEEVLQTGMDKLRIYDCCFSRSPSKVGLPSTLRLLTISNCTKVDHLLHQLFRCPHPVLQNLWINGGTYDSTLPLSFSLSDIFPGLTYFGIYQLEGLEKLCISSSDGHSVSLRNLEINGCGDLVCVKLPACGSISHRISHCCKLRLLVHTHSSLQKLTLEQCPELLFPVEGEQLPSELSELQVWCCNKLTPRVDWDLQRLRSLTKFTIMGGCEDVELFPNECLLPSSLAHLSIMSLPNLRSLHGEGLQQLTSLVKLSITRCSELQALAGNVLQHLASLKEIKISSCRRLESLAEAGLHCLMALEILDIGGCHELKCFTKERLSDSVSSLIVELCPLLKKQFEFEKGPEWCYISHIPKIVIDHVLL